MSEQFNGNRFIANESEGVLFKTTDGKLLEGKNAVDYLSKVTVKENNMNEKDTSFASKINSGILGLAIGDALGVPLEFKPRNSYEHISDMIGYGSHNMPEGTWSDDTSMTLATAYSIIDNQGYIDYDDIMNNYLLWIDKAYFTANKLVFDYGYTTIQAINNYKNGVSSIECGLQSFDNNGNGSLMRILPFVLCSYNYNFDEDEDTKLINSASAMTHAHDISKLGCKIYSIFIRQLLSGKTKDEALKYIQQYDYLKFYSKDTLNFYEKLLTKNILTLKIDEIKSNGYVVNTLLASIWCTVNCTSFEDALECAVNLGGDTDTIGAVTGSINGILYGQENIPKRWIDKLQAKDFVLDIADRFGQAIIDNKNFNKKRK